MNLLMERCGVQIGLKLRSFDGQIRETRDCGCTPRTQAARQGAWSLRFLHAFIHSTTSSVSSSCAVLLSIQLSSTTCRSNDLVHEFSGKMANFRSPELKNDGRPAGSKLPCRSLLPSRGRERKSILLGHTNTLCARKTVVVRPSFVTFVLRKNYSWIYPNSSQCRRDDLTSNFLPGTDDTRNWDIDTRSVASTVRQQIDICAAQLPGIRQPGHASIVLHLQVPVWSLLDVVCHLCAHKAGRDGVDADAVLCPFHRECVCHVAHGSLGASVGC
jgi:hypothetical protein